MPLSVLTSTCGAASAKGDEGTLLQPSGVAALGMDYFAVSDTDNDCVVLLQHVGSKVLKRGALVGVCGESGSGDAEEAVLGRLHAPLGLVASFVRSQPTLYIADSRNGAVRKVVLTRSRDGFVGGALSTITRGVRTPFGLSLHPFDGSMLWVRAYPHV